MVVAQLAERSFPIPKGLWFEPIQRLNLKKKQLLRLLSNCYNLSRQIEIRFVMSMTMRDLHSALDDESKVYIRTYSSLG